MKKPEKELHNHNSIPSYTADLEEGCIFCVRNQAIEEYEKFLPSVDEIEQIIWRFSEYDLDDLNVCLNIAEAIHRRLT